MDLVKVREKDADFGMPWVPGGVVLPFREAESAVYEIGQPVVARCISESHDLLARHLNIAREGGIGHMTEHADRELEMFCGELRMRKRIAERVLRDLVATDKQWQEHIFDRAAIMARMDAIGIFPAKVRRSA